MHKNKMIQFKCNILWYYNMIYNNITSLTNNIHELDIIVVHTLITLIGILHIILLGMQFKTHKTQ